MVQRPSIRPSRPNVCAREAMAESRPAAPVLGARLGFARPGVLALRDLAVRVGGHRNLPAQYCGSAENWFSVAILSSDTPMMLATRGGKLVACFGERGRLEVGRPPVNAAG